MCLFTRRSRESKNKSIYELSEFHAKQSALTVIDSRTPALIVAQNVNAAMCGAQQVSLKSATLDNKSSQWEITSSHSRYDDGKIRWVGKFTLQPTIALKSCFVLNVSKSLSVS